jgi:hypothetical protein
MRERHIHGASRRKGFKTTLRDMDTRPAPDLVDRKFSADAPDRELVASSVGLQGAQLRGPSTHDLRGVQRDNKRNKPFRIGCQF